MNDLPTKKRSGPYPVFMVVALVCGASCFGIALIVSLIVGRLARIEEGFMFACASMVAWPAIMGVGISYFVYRTSRFQPPKDLD